MRLILLIFLLLPLCATAQDRTFHAEGSDASAGVGGRHTALGGAGVAATDDAFAVFYNPAALAFGTTEVAASRQLDATLRKVNYLAATVPLRFAETFGLRAGVGLAFFPRIHATSTGAYADTDLESVFLRYLLPGIPGTFDGEIETKTKEYRLGLGIAPLTSDRWALGASIGFVDCKSNYCGVRATGPGYSVSSADAKAISVNLGLIYRPTERLTLGATLNDLNTHLNVRTITTDDTGTYEETFPTAFPSKLTVGASYQLTANAIVLADYETIQGNYGTTRLDFRVFRLGYERTKGAFTHRFGLMVPIKTQATGKPPIELPFPAAPSFGIGWHQDGVRIDLGIYAHPIMSLHDNRPHLSADLSIGWQF